MAFQPSYVALGMLFHHSGPRFSHLRHRLHAKVLEARRDPRPAPHGRLEHARRALPRLARPRASSPARAASRIAGRGRGGGGCPRLGRCAPPALPFTGYVSPRPPKSVLPLRRLSPEGRGQPGRQETAA